MFPLMDENPHSTVPYVNYSIIGLNILIFIFEISLPIQSLKLFMYNYGVVPARYFSPSLVSGFNFTSDPLIPFLSSMFLHGGWLHIIFNMWALFIFGDNVEDKLGHLNYLLFYLGTGLIAGMTHAIFNYNSVTPSIGASGGIAWWAHIGGFIAGMGLLSLFKKTGN